MDKLAEIISEGTIEDKIATMALLEPADYDQIRKLVADLAGMRVTTLDAEVSKRRKPTASPGLSFIDVEPWVEPVDGAELLNFIVAELRRFLVMPQESMDAVALWLVMTWAVDATFILPMLAISSLQKRFGKSTLLILLRKIARKALLVSNTSSAAIFRIVEKHQPTLLLDEAETWSKENEELRGINRPTHAQDAHAANFTARQLDLFRPQSA